MTCPLHACTRQDRWRRQRLWRQAAPISSAPWRGCGGTAPAEPHRGERNRLPRWTIGGHPAAAPLADSAGAAIARVLLMLVLRALGPAPSFAGLSRVFATY